MYGIKDADILAFNYTVKKYVPFGYHPVKFTLKKKTTLGYKSTGTTSSNMLTSPCQGIYRKLFTSFCTNPLPDQNMIPTNGHHLLTDRKFNMYYNLHHSHF